ncbi:MAG: ribonuclease P protein component [Patescibacteria group bacterium]|nr:ribonuclease P protein component [Patescibacteria group bacterium]MBU1877016.1 ribonuclease P protein component [Patescibacteria group bacterium]
MLNKSHRLKKNNDIVKVLKEGKKFIESFLIIKTLPNNLEETRFAFIISKKFSKKAVVRNRIRRQISEGIKDNLETIKKGIDVVILSIPGVQERDTEEVRKTVKKLLDKANLITK